MALAGQRVAVLNQQSECRASHRVRFQAGGPTENPFLYAWLSLAGGICLGQTEFPQQRNENRVDEFSAPGLRPRSGDPWTLIG
jgi:hypothetical protein